MLTLEIINDGTGATAKEPNKNDGLANYDYTVKVNHAVIAYGRIEGHDRLRKDTWQSLVAKVSLHMYE